MSSKPVSAADLLSQYENANKDEAYSRYLPVFDASRVDQNASGEKKWATCFKAATSYAQVAASYAAPDNKLKKQDELITKIAELCQAYAALNSQTDEENEDGIDLFASAETVTRLSLWIVYIVTIAIKILKAIFGFVGSAIESIAGIMDALFGKERSSMHNKRWDKIKLALAVLLLNGTVLDLLHTLIGFGPVAFSALIGIVCAAFTVGAVLQEGYYVYRAVRKILGIKYFIGEREEAITAELNLLLNRKERPTMDELVRVNKKITVLKAQAEALRYYKTCKEKGNLAPDGQSVGEEQKIALAKFLIEKEKSKAKEHALKCFIWVAAAAVLITAAILMPPSLIILGLIMSTTDVSQMGVDVAYNKYTGVSLNHAIVKDTQQNNVGLNTDPVKTSKKETQNRLLKEALVDTGLNLDMAKKCLSEKDQQELIHKQARREYARDLKVKAREVVSNAGSTVHSLATDAAAKANSAASNISSAFYSFFGGTAAKDENPSILPTQSAQEINIYMGK